MSIGVKVVERPIEQTSYVRATLTGMKHTLKHMLNPEKVTTQYPEQKESISKRWRGTHRMLTTEDGIQVTNSIFLEPEVYAALLEYVSRLKQRERVKEDIF